MLALNHCRFVDPFRLVQIGKFTISGFVSIIFWYLRIQGGPERMQHCDQYFQENEGQNENVVCIIAYKILFPIR